MKRTISILLLSFLFFSCESKLSNEQAKAVISNDYTFYHCKGKLNNSNMNVDFVNGKPLSNRGKRISEIHSKLEEQGYVYISQRRYSRVGVSKTINLTEKSEPFDLKNKNVTVTYQSFGDITGISQDGDKATVQFTIINKKSPFFDLFRKDKCPTGTIQREVQLTRFDTGWKLSK